MNTDEHGLNSTSLEIVELRSNFKVSEMREASTLRQAQYDSRKVGLVSQTSHSNVGFIRGMNPTAVFIQNQRLKLLV